MNERNIPKPYYTGVDSMDRQHREIVEIEEELFDSLNNLTSKTNLQNLCIRLVTTLRQHYDDEERLMLKYFFPDTEAHIGLHMNYLLMLGKLIQSINNSDLEAAKNTLSYMIRWKIDHINDADRKYADFIHEKSA